MFLRIGRIGIDDWQVYVVFLNSNTESPVVMFLSPWVLAASAVIVFVLLLLLKELKGRQRNFFLPTKKGVKYRKRRMG